MSPVRVVRKVARSLYQLTLKPAEPDDTCVMCLRPAYVVYEGECFREVDSAERFADELFHAKVYAKAIGAHSDSVQPR